MYAKISQKLKEKGGDMKKFAFTLVEVLVGLIIIAVLAALSITTFQKTVQTHNDKLCQENLKVLQGAIEIYTLENNALPVILSQLTQEQINLAYSKVIGTHQDNKFLAFFKNLLGIKPALAASIDRMLPPRYHGNNRKVLRCPSDTIANPMAISYKINGIITDLGDSDTESRALVTDIRLNHKKSSVNSGNPYRNAINQIGDLGRIFTTRNFVINEWIESVTPISDFTPTLTTCCFDSREKWRALPLSSRKTCKDAGFKSPQIDGAPRGNCVPSLEHEISEYGEEDD